MVHTVYKYYYTLIYYIDKLYHKQRNMLLFNKGYNILMNHINNR